MHSLTARHLVVGVSRQPNFGALNRGRHLCSAGRLSGWALAHILVQFNFNGCLPVFIRHAEHYHIS